VVVVSDGAENDRRTGRARCCACIGSGWRSPESGSRSSTSTRRSPPRDTRCAPCSRPATPPTVGLRDGEDLPTALGFARFAAGASSLADLEEYLAERARRMIAPAADAEMEEREST
jgi:hypothetical protein